MDLVLAAAAAKGVEERAVEETRPLSCPLDVLAQVLLEMALEGPISVDALYDIVLSFPPFERLPRSLFDSTLQMLAGKYSGTRLRELEPRIAIDAASGTVAGGQGARGLLYSSGGTIPDRGLFQHARRRLEDEDRRARRGIRLGTQGRRGFHARRPDLEDNRDRQRGGDSSCRPLPIPTSCRSGRARRASGAPS
jgi:hypothetical protein